MTFGREWGRRVGWITRVPGNVVTQVFVFLFIDPVKKEVEHGVNHGSARSIEFQVGLGNVGNFMSSVDQYVVPGLVSVGLGLVGLIPGNRRLTGRIRINDEPSVPVLDVVHDLPRYESGKFFFGRKALIQVDHEKSQKKGPLE